MLIMRIKSIKNGENIKNKNMKIISQHAGNNLEIKGNVPEM